MKNQTAIITAVLLTAAALTITTTMSLPVASAQDKKENAQDGLNEADENVHTNTGDLSDQDFAFHEGICQGGHSTDVLDEVTKGAGCDALDPPGESGDNRQDE
jgi:hypothetical protein